jgi:preprotein translocase subunit SecE
MAAVTQSNDGKKAMADEEQAERDEEREQRQAPQQRPAPQTKPKPAGGPSFFTIYKKGQGYWTRMGTAIGAGFLGLVIAFELYHQIPTFLPGGAESAQRDNRIALGVALAFLAAYSIWAYWFTNKPSTVDFLVATDSEMKKVNWTSRKDLIASTKIVIIFMLIIAVFLFSCDLLFGAFFHLIGVLKTWF